MSGEPTRRLLPEAFALVVEVSRRIFGYRHHDVQILGGIELHDCRIAEMKTGEGKTLTATLPVYIHALSGLGTHVVTVNDYLAERDHDAMREVYMALGLSSDVIKADDSPENRAEAYRKDITYASVKELGFDFLRDRLRKKQQSSEIVPPLYFCLIDEADSVLLDEARTPLIIGMHDMEDKELLDGCYRWAAKHATDFIDKHDFIYDKLKQKVDLTYQGRSRVRTIPQNEATRLIPILQLFKIMEKAIKANRDLLRETHYDIIGGKVVIIDEYTGRPADGRQWQDGIHQCVEAKEEIDISPATKAAAMITIQDLFARYPKIAGMTGTGLAAKREFKKVYKKSVVPIACNRPVARKQYTTQIFQSYEEKIDAIIAEAKEMIAVGRAVLIGTRSVEVSESVAESLTRNGLNHQVLNSRNLSAEAEIVAQAGMSKSITVATNMAGRGTDIKLDSTVRTKGGLHVILSEIHESKRIDWQLIGRGARQGDPGSFRIFLSLADEILRKGLVESHLNLIIRIPCRKENMPRLFKYFLLAQKNIEQKHLIDRLMLLRHNKDRYKALIDTGQDPLIV